jgi:hypothetical protein
MARVALGVVTVYDVLDGSEGSVTYSYDSTSVGAVVPTANVIGDTLVDLGDGNKLYIAESAGADEIKAGEWVEITATADAVGAAPYSIMYNTTEIDGGNIRTGTIDANNITTGYLSASRVAAGVIYDNTHYIFTAGVITGENSSTTYKMKIDLTNGSIHIK